MDVVHGVDTLGAAHGRLFVVVGVFDGLHLGHRYLLEQLVAESIRRDARPTVITFDHHPDEILTGAAPALLMDPGERLERLAAAGVGVTVVQHFDAALRTTPYDVFVARLRARIDLAGFLMTPDAAFGFERRGTPERLGELGLAVGFEVVVVAPFMLDGRPVSSSAIRSAIASGDLAAAETMLGHEVTLRAAVTGTTSDGEAVLGFPLPVALPVDGTYRGVIGGEPTSVRVVQGTISVRPIPTTPTVSLHLVSRT